MPDSLAPRCPSAKGNAALAVSVRSTALRGAAMPRRQPASERHVEQRAARDVAAEDDQRVERTARSKQRDACEQHQEDAGGSNGGTAAEARPNQGPGREKSP